MIEIKKFTFKIIIILIIKIVFLTHNLQAIENKILFRIDNEIITSIDIYNTSKYLVALDNDVKNLNETEIFELSKNVIIRSKIKKIAINNENIALTIQEKVLNSYIKSIFANKKINNLDDYKIFVKSINLNYDKMKEGLVIDLLWNNFIFQKYSSKLKINREELKKEIQNEKYNNITSYLLSEIVFEASSKSEIELKYKKIQKDIKNLGFKKSALINSIAESSNKGGNIGWIKETSLNKKILNILKNQDIDKYSKPILIPGGFLILKIEDKKIVERNLDIDKELNKLIQLKTNQQLNQYSNIYFNKIKKGIQINEF